MKNLGKWFKGLSPILQVVFFVVGIVVLWYLFNRVRGFMRASKESAETQSELNVLEINGVNASYSSSEYEQMATQLYNALEGMGTDEDSVYAVFGRLKNDMDFIRLKSAFGIRDSYGFQEWIDGDLSQSEKDKVNALMSSKGITKRI